MLVLTRKVGEVIRIGEDIQIYVASIKDKVVRIGITAPANLRVDREEIYQARKENGEK